MRAAAAAAAAEARRALLAPNSPSVHSAPMSTYSSKHNRRPQKKIYHRVPELDKAIDLSKKPALILKLRSIIASRGNGSILVRDLEKEVGFVQKWTHLSLIQRHPTIFRVSGGGGGARSPIAVGLTGRAERLSLEERQARILMEPILVKNLRKLLMMSLDCRIPIEKIELVAPDMGLPENFKTGFLTEYPEFFSVRDVDGLDHLCLESWDSSLAVTAREERLDLGRCPENRKVIAKDGNYYSLPFAFRMKFSPGFRPNASYLEELRKWQRLGFPSPYLNARRVESGTPQARKRAVAVLHEILSLMMEKRLTSDKLDAFHNEFQLPCKLLLCLVKNHGIFYITNKGARSTVLLKEAYDGSNLIEKCPLLRFRDRFMALIGRTCPDLGNPLPVQHIVGI